MNIFLLPVPIIAVFSLVLGFFVLLQNYKLAVNRSFFACCLVVFIWFFGHSLMYMSQESMMALLVGKIGFAGVLFIPAVFFHFTIQFLNDKKKKKFIPILYGLSSVYALLMFSTHSIIKGVSKFTWGYYTVAGFLHPIFLLFFLTTYIVCVIFLFCSLKYDRSAGVEIIKRRYVFWAFAIPTFSCIDFIPQYGYAVYPQGYIFIFGWLAMVAYSILRYHFLDIRIVFTRGAILLMVYLSIVVIPLGFAVLAQGWLRSNFYGQWFYPPLALYTILALIAPYIYLQLQTKSEHKLMQRQVKLHQSLKNASKTTIEVQSIDKLSKIIPRYLLRLYSVNMNNKISHISLFLKEKGKNIYTLRTSVGDEKM